MMNPRTRIPPPTILWVLLGSILTLLIGTGCADTDAALPDDGSPRLTLAQTPDPERPFARITADLWTQHAIKIHLALYGMDAETLHLIRENTGLTLADYLETYGSALAPAALDLANSAVGFHYPFVGISSGADCSLCAAAWNAEGRCITQICEFTAPVYPYRDGQTTWKPVSTDATLECGFLKAMDGPSLLTIEHLTVEKATDEDVYRIADLFASVRSEIEASEHFSVFTEDKNRCYFIIDARDPSAVCIEPLESQINLPYDQQSIFVGSGPFWGYNESADIGYGTFDRQNDTLELGILPVRYMKSTGVNTFNTLLSIDSSPSRLRLNVRPE